MSKIEQDLQCTFYDDEWVGLCRERSFIQALKEMYRNTCLEEHLSNIDTEDLNDHFRSVGDYEGYLAAEKIPVGIPHSHWWWYPKNRKHLSRSSTHGASVAVGYRRITGG